MSIPNHLLFYSIIALSIPYPQWMIPTSNNLKIMDYWKNLKSSLTMKRTSPTIRAVSRIINFDHELRDNSTAIRVWMVHLFRLYGSVPCFLMWFCQFFVWKHWPWTEQLMDSSFSSLQTGKGCDLLNAGLVRCLAF